MRTLSRISQTRSKAASLAILLACAAVPAVAHHSRAMFDGAKTDHIEGTVKQFQWTNPHSWLEVTVPGPNGGDVWAFEMGSAGTLAAQGLKPRSIARGEKVTVTYHPMRDGTKGGQFLIGNFESGLVVDTRGNFRPLEDSSTDAGN